MSTLRKTTLANSSNYGQKRKLSEIKFIVIHYTANDGDTDEANARYFQTPNRHASAHYFVDDDSITQSVHDDTVAWHCGGGLYNNALKQGGGSFYKQCTNKNSIGIEMCDTKRDKVHNISDQTRANTIELIVELMKKYNISIDNVIRHFDVTGKLCPLYFVEDSGAWLLFKDDIKKSLLQGQTPSSTPSTPAIQSTPSSTPSTPDNVPFKVKILADGLNIRVGAGTGFSKIGTITDHGVYTIVETNQSNTWGLLKSGRGWISLSSKYVKRLD